MKKTFSLAELSQLTNSLLVGDPDHLISNVDGLGSAGENDASFLANPRYAETMKESKAGVICVDRNTPLIEGKNFLISDDPSHIFQTIVEHLLCTKTMATAFQGIHERAFVHESANISPGVTIAPGACIDRNVQIGEGSFIGPNVSIGPGTIIGKDCLIHANVTIREGTVIGHRVIVQPGAVIGSCGFGYLTDKQGRHQKLNQLGIVILEDDVEIGANTTIDRARFKTTVISKGSKIDNQVQIGHNVIVGPHNIIAAQSGIAGSSTTEEHVMIGPQSGITGHVLLCRYSQFAARSGVSKSITEPGPYRGSPVIPLNEFNKREVYLRNIKKLVQRVEKLEKLLAEKE